MKNSFIKKLLFVLVLMLTLTGCGGGDSSEKNSSAASDKNSSSSETVEARTAIIFKIMDGTGVTLERGADSEEAYEGMRLSAGDNILTDGISSAYLRIDDDKNVLLNTNSKITITELSNGKLKLKLEYGDFFFNVENKLADDESMEFSIGSTSMSIRGTSGAGKLSDEGSAAFSIYTGKGEVTDEIQTNISYELIPNTIVKFSVEQKVESIFETATLSTVTKDDISDLVSDYLESNDDYADELKEDGWTADTEKGMAPDQEAIAKQMADANKDSAWKQNSDGTWTNTKAQEQNTKSTNETSNKQTNASTKTTTDTKKQENTNTSGGSTPTVTTNYIAKPTVTNGTDFTYDGNEVTVISGYDSNTMTLSGTMTATNAGTYTLSITPKANYAWSDTKNVAPFEVTWKINPIEVEITGTYKKAFIKVADGKTTVEEQYTGSTSVTLPQGLTIKQIATTSSAAANAADDESYIATNEFVIEGVGYCNYTIKDNYAKNVIVHISAQ